jgi:hypothetical protein
MDIYFSEFLYEMILGSKESLSDTIYNFIDPLK